MGMRVPLVAGEWYHCFNRGTDKRKVFNSARDYERFLALVYVGNGTKPVQTSHLQDNRLEKIVSDESLDWGEPLVEVGAYALMPNHVHLVLKEIRQNGISLFMQKIFTGYTMYFNRKNERTGGLFAGTYKSKHIKDDCYLKRVVPYVHCNPIELYEPRWKNGKGNLSAIEKYLHRYPYSSLPDFLQIKRPERKLLGESIFELFGSTTSIKETLADAQAYYQEIS